MTKNNNKIEARSLRWCTSFAALPHFFSYFHYIIIPTPSVLFYVNLCYVVDAFIHSRFLLPVFFLIRTCGLVCSYMLYTYYTVYTEHTHSASFGKIGKERYEWRDAHAAVNKINNPIHLIICTLYVFAFVSMRVRKENIIHTDVDPIDSCNY